MEINDTENNRPLRHVGLGLTEAEAQELRDTLDALLLGGAGPARHEHVSSADFEHELTVWLARPLLGVASKNAGPSD